MRFEWDENKNRSNFAKHGIGFQLAIRALVDPHAISESDPFVIEEDRWLVVGSAGGDLLLLVVYTDRSYEDVEILRIISARKVTPHERRRYEKRKNRSL